MALTDETISTLTESISKIIESNLTELILKRLDSFGYEPTVDDDFIIGFSVHKVLNKIKNECNVDEVPEGLTDVAVDMVCGEILGTLYRTGKLNLTSLDLDGALASVNVGGASVSFDSNTSNDNKLNTLVSLLLNDGRGELACYRQIRW